MLSQVSTEQVIQGNTAHNKLVQGLVTTPLSAAFQAETGDWEFKASWARHSHKQETNNKLSSHKKIRMNL